MKAISLWEPYATLIALGEKSWETRGWPTKHRGRIAIHAALKWNDELFHTASQEPFLSSLDKHGVAMPGGLAFGCIVAVVDVGEIITTTEWLHRHCTRELIENGNPHEREYHFGNYAPDRFAWHFTGLRRLAKPVPCRGAQLIWNVPADVEAEIERQLAA